MTSHWPKTILLWTVLTVFVVAVLLMVRACGGTDDQQHAVSAAPTTPSPSEPPTAPPTTTTTTVIPIPTTLPTTTTRPRLAPTPEVQGNRAAVTDEWINEQLIKIGRCEQPGDGMYGINWSHRGPRYQGGLGLYSATYLDNRPSGAPDNAGDATISQQLAAGRKIYYRYGFGAWGCAAAVGLG